MPLSIPNTTLLDAFSDTTTFAGHDVFAWGFFTVANNPAFVQLFQGLHGQNDLQPEIYCPPATYPIAGGPRQISGIRARNAISGSPAQFFGSMFYPEEPGIQAGTPFTGIISATGAVSLGVGVLQRDTSLVDVAGSAAEQTLYSYLIPGNSLTTDALLRWTAMGDYLFNNNVANTCTIRIRFGGTIPLAGAIVAAAPAGSTVLSGNRQPWSQTLLLGNLGALNSHIITLTQAAVQPDLVTGAATVGIGGLHWRNDFLFEGGTLGISVPNAVDLSSDQLLEVTAQWSAASANNSFRKRYALLEGL